MGYTSDITNRIDGKKYLISTAQDKKGGGWQTAVLKHRLFGIPDLLHPAMFIGAPDEEHARQVHARVEEIVAELPSSEWESAKWGLFGEVLDKAFPEPDVSTHPVLPDTRGADWSVFHGVPNTQEVLRKKAKVIARLIEMGSDVGELASALRENPNYPEVHVGEEEVRLIHAETAVVLFRFIDEIASGVLAPEQQAALMEESEVCVAGMFDSKGAAPVWEFTDLLSKRYAEYAHLRVWATNEEKGGLLYEYTKKIGAIINLGEHAQFNAMLANLLLRSLERWELKELLEG